MLLYLLCPCCIGNTLPCVTKKIRQITKGIPALTLTPEEETVDRALAKDISRDLSLMMLAASIAKTAMASLQVESPSKGEVCELDHK